jgi:hypothetical protein
MFFKCLFVITIGIGIGIEHAGIIVLFDFDEIISAQTLSTFDFVNLA